METYGLEQLGIVNTAAVYRNLTPAQLTEHALRRGEGTLSATGALVVGHFDFFHGVHLRFSAAFWAA